MYYLSCKFQGYIKKLVSYNLQKKMGNIIWNAN